MSDNDASDTVLNFGKRVKKTAQGPEESDAAEQALQQARARSREAMMLDVKLKDGTIESFDYSLPKRVTYKPDGTLILRFGDDTIRLGGINLERVRLAVTEGRARLIQVGTQAEEDLKPEEAAHIAWIEIVKRQEQADSHADAA
jgi:hypothetical protein